MYIYVDILVITNIYADFFLLKTTARLTHTPLRGGKCVLGALVGSLFSLIILLPPMGSFLLALIRVFAAALTVLVAFGGGQTLRELAEKGAVFLFVSFIFAGMEYGLAVLAGGKNMLWRNSTLYVNISLPVLIISTVFSYAAVSLFRRFLDGRNAADVRYDVIITKNGKTVSIAATADTGNNLTDVFTGKPVIICGKSSAAVLFPTGEADKACGGTVTHVSGWRLIPFSTVHSDGMLPVFKPDSAVIKCAEKGLLKNVDVYIGVVCREMDSAVFNPKILN